MGDEGLFRFRIIQVLVVQREECGEMESEVGARERDCRSRDLRCIIIHVLR